MHGLGFSLHVKSGSILRTRNPGGKLKRGALFYRMKYQTAKITTSRPGKTRECTGTG